MIVSGVEIKVVKKDIKNMHLSVLPPAGIVRVSVPHDASDDAIRLFVVGKVGWVKKQIDKFQSQPRQTERQYVSGESHYLWGRRYMLVVEHAKTANNVEIKGNKLILTVRAKSTTEQRERVVNEWYRRELKAKLPTLISKWEDKVGVKVDDWGVKNMKTRWGTCNPDAKRIWINLQLAKKPVKCLEYIVVHELVHLLEKNHTLAFIAYMDELLPHWRAVKAELNDFIMDRYIEE